ncbi:hypothetical protein LIER_04897 [Lithospermum erythrorhizon]|uniref:Reverse transcriptase Ty1/copia-type domain-containing protein n=1 Tax=Lithospermum erythrorhizon TaxID=34254 RepID=A0AAV3P2J1_LITER
MSACLPLEQDILLQEEKQQEISHNPHVNVEASTFYSNKSFTPGRGRGWQNNDGGFKPRPQLFCDHCKIARHSVQRCYKIHGYPSNNTRKITANAVEKSLSDEQFNKLVGIQNNTSVSSSNGTAGDSHALMAGPFTEGTFGACCFANASYVHTVNKDVSHSAHVNISSNDHVNDKSLSYSDSLLSHSRLGHLPLDTILHIINILKPSFKSLADMSYLLQQSFVQSKASGQRLKKSLYGLKQASRQCFAKLHEALLSLGSDSVAIKALKSYLHTNFSIKYLGQLNCFLGLQISIANGKLFMNQSKYVNELVNDSGIL